MKREPVKSTNIASAGYEDGVLEVEFKSGKVYRIKDVEPGEYFDFVTARSVGGYFAQHLRGRPSELVTEEKA